MIGIEQYVEMLHDIRGKVNSGSEVQIEKVILAAKEEHLVKKLKDESGILLCGNYPDCDTVIEHRDRWRDNNHCVLFVIEKVPAGKHTKSQELAHYAQLQALAERIKSILIDDNFSCDYQFDSPKEVRAEWEYAIFGGFNGVSLGFQLVV